MSGPPDIFYQPRDSEGAGVWSKRGLLLLIALSILLAGTLFGPRLWQRLQLFHLQRQAVAGFNPAEVVLVQAGETNQRGWIPSQWSEFYSRLSPPGLKSDGTLFLGEMRSTAHSPRLVALDVHLDQGLGNTPVVWLAARVIIPGTLWQRPQLLPARQGLLLLGSGERQVQIEPARRDPEHQNHLTIRVVEDGQAVTVHLWLTETDEFRLERSTSP